MHVTPGHGTGNLVAHHRPHPFERKDMPNVPLANLEVPAGTPTADQKRQLVDAVTDGGWGMGGQILTKARILSKAVLES
jgi:hypothetical protein